MAYRMLALIAAAAGVLTPVAASADPTSEADAKALAEAAFAGPAEIAWRAPEGDLFALKAADADLLTGLSLGDGRLTRWSTRETSVSDAGRLRLSIGSELREANGAPVAAAGDRPRGAEADRFDVAYLHQWPSAVRLAGNGYALDVTPQAGLSVGSAGGGAEAGATVRFGEDLESRLRGIVRDGESFGDRGRWYLFAAASGRAVGYNFLRSEGGWERSGVSTDKGAYIGDAQAGVAWRKGDLQASFGYVHREVKTLDYEKDDGFVAFQLSLKPTR